MRIDDGRHVLNLERRDPRELPAPLQRVRELPHLDRIERLLQDQHAVRLAERRRHLFPAVIRVRGADHDADVGVLAQQPRRRLDSVEARRHPHVDEQQRVAAAFGARAPDFLDGLLALVRGVELEALLRRFRRSAEQLGVERVQRVARAGRAAEDLA